MGEEIHSYNLKFNNLCNPNIKYYYLTTLLKKINPMLEPKNPNQKLSQPKTAIKRVALTKKSTWSKMWWVLGGLLVLSATAVAAKAVYFPTKPLQQHQLSLEESAIFEGDSFASSNLVIPSLTRPVHILVLGMSVLPSDVNNPQIETKNLSYQPQIHSVDGLSDTMLLLRFDPKPHKMTILSIPRDTRIVMEKYGVQKINAANVYGGSALAAKEVSKLLTGVKIDRYVRVNVLALGKIVDALGGITVSIPKNMKYTDETQHLYIDLKKGEQHLNGEQTLQLLRFRHDALGDIGRIQRQQLVLHALMQQALKPTLVTRIPQLFQAIKSDVDTNLSIEELTAMGIFAAHIDRANVQALTVPGDFNGNGRHAISYWLPDHRRIKTMMANEFNVGASSQ
ncbi:MAG: hypothetical protein NVS2B14_05530 [Chamaesiphon sp.]